MRLKEITGEVLQEAARFGNRERMEILKEIGNFRIGCEYEFNTHEGVPFLDKALNLTNPMDSPLIKNLSPHLSKLSKGVSRLEQLGGIESLRGYSKDMQDFIRGGVSEEEIEYFNDVVLPELSEMATAFYLGVQQPSEVITKTYKGSALEGMGVLDKTTVRPQELSDIAYVASLKGKNIGISPQTAQKARVVADAIRRYLVLDAELKPSTMQADKHYNGMLSVLHSEVVEYQQNTPSKIQLVRDTLPINKQFIQAIMPDATVPNGVEVITTPLQYRDMYKTMENVFAYIQKNGYTDNTTGLHVNISVSGKYDLTSVNFVKMMTLLDVEFFQGLTKGAKNYMKYPVRSEWVDPIFNFLRKEYVLSFLTKVFAYNGEKSFIREFEEAVTKDNTKKRAVNLKHLLNADVNQRRVEFRFFGGNSSAGYEFRFEEIQNDILQICYMIAASADENFLRREYLQSIIRIMDRAVKETKIEGIQFNSFSSAVNYFRTQK